MRLKHDINFNSTISKFHPDVVIHLASYLTASDSYEDINNLLDSNIYFLNKVLNAVSKLNLKLFINTGTFSEYYYGDEKLIPAYFYAATKTAGRSFVDYYSLVNGFKQCTVIPYTIYGPNDSQKKILNIIYDSTKSDTPYELTAGDQVLDFIHVDDIVDLYIQIVKNIENLPKKNIFKAGTGIGYSLREVAKIIEQITNSKANIKWGSKKYRKSDVMYAVSDISHTKKILNWKPKISFKDGLNFFLLDE